MRRCLIIDCHSFPSIALPYELDQSERRADFCIGTDAFHTPPAVRDAIVAGAKQAGYSVAVDAPFAGALVPLASYRKDRRIWSVMIEVNLDLLCRFAERVREARVNSDGPQQESRPLGRIEL